MCAHSRVRVQIRVTLRSDAHAGKDRSSRFLPCSQSWWAQFGYWDDFLPPRLSACNSECIIFYRDLREAEGHLRVFSPPGAQALRLTLRTERLRVPLHGRQAAETQMHS